MFNETLLTDAGLWLIAASTLGYIVHGVTHHPWLRHGAWGLLALAVLSLIGSLVLRSFHAEYFALSNMYEALLVANIGLCSAFLVVERWFKIPQLGWGVCLLALVIMFYTGQVPTDINPLQAALQSYWRSIHVPPLLLSYGLFSIAFLSALAYLWSDRHPKTPLPVAPATRDGGDILMSFASSSELYDEVTYRCIAAGFPLLMIGVILGAIWANEAWGNYWSWDPKESMSLVTLLGYGAYLHMRINGEHSKRTLAYVAIGGFLLVLMTFVGVNMWGFGSLHSYGSVQ